LIAAAATICYFVFLTIPDLAKIALYLADAGHSALLLFSLIAVWIGFCR
jgi:hypothetical protein